MSERVACMRCGDFAESEALPLRELELCARCLQGERDLPLPGAGLSGCVPAPLTAKRLALVLALGTVGALAGGRGALAIALVLQSSFGAARDPVWEIGWAAAGGVVGWALLGGPALIAGPERSRRLLLARLGLERSTKHFFEAILTERGSSSILGSPAQEWGVVAFTIDGFAFLGAKGTKCVCRVADMRSAKLGTDSTALRRALVVELMTGRTVELFLLFHESMDVLATTFAALILERDRRGAS
jgi:hypothetical protein